MTEKRENIPVGTTGKSKISRREFLKDAGLIVGGATIGSMALVNACGNTETVTAPGATKTVTSTVPAAPSTTTSPPAQPLPLRARPTVTVPVGERGLPTSSPDINDVD